MFLSRSRFALVLTLATLPIRPIVAEPAPNETAGWKSESQSGGISLFSQLRPGSSLKKFKAIGDIDAPVAVVHAVIDDFESYPSFMPYTVECRVIKRENGGPFFYQRLSPKIVSDRDYTLRVREKSWRGATGLIFEHSFGAANEAGPPESKGFARVKVCEGAWVFEPVSPNRTRVTYTIDTDSGGKVPAFIANPATALSIRKVFAAVRKQVKEPKYNMAAR